jgi:hypothetical protein
MGVGERVPDADRRFRLNEPAVVADIIDGEVVIMNLERGNYYHLDKNGAGIWRLLLDGFTPDEIAAAAAKRYGSHEADISRDIAGLVARLVEEQLIVFVGTGAKDRSIAEDIFSLPAYSAATLAVYSDMKDLLALDPPLPMSNGDLSV